VVVAELESRVLGERAAREEPLDSAWVGKRVEYALVYENRKGRESSISEIARIDPAPPLAPPGPPAAEAGDGFVALRWAPPPKAPPDLEFSVRRKRADAEGYGAATLNAEPITGGSFEDRTAVFGEASCYVVVATVPSRSVSSLPSEEVCITPEDRYPPPAPEALVAVPAAGAILLSWRHADAPDRKGYRVYRGASRAGPFEFLGEVAETSFRDESVGSDETLFYYVTAIDSAAGVNESEPSGVVEVVLR
jgi:fibronectin type 3 domain-containing protein